MWIWSLRFGDSYIVCVHISFSVLHNQNVALQKRTGVGQLTITYNVGCSAILLSCTPFVVCLRSSPIRPCLDFTWNFSVTPTLIQVRTLFDGRMVKFAIPCK
jgi:hypothetical protein